MLKKFVFVINVLPIKNKRILSKEYARIESRWIKDNFFVLLRGYEKEGETERRCLFYKISQKSDPLHEK
jgi:hypothetical protein